jgi:flagellar L-ring protein precursor FlgH
LIGPREYKIIVTGIVRAEDFNEEGISATKLLDSKFDIVSARRKEDL